MTQKASLSSDIRFGADGWRGLIADTFPFDNVRRVSQTMADELKQRGQAQRGIVVGYDRRFLSEQFAQEVACVLAANGIPVSLANAPAMSDAAVQKDAVPIADCGLLLNCTIA